MNEWMSTITGGSFIFLKPQKMIKMSESINKKGSD